MSNIWFRFLSAGCANPILVHVDAITAVKHIANPGGEFDFSGVVVGGECIEVIGDCDEIVNIIVSVESPHDDGIIDTEDVLHSRAEIASGE